MNFKKLALIIGLATAGTFSANAQISLGLTGGMGLPMGDMANKDKMDLGSGFGGGLTGRYFLNDNMAVGLNLSYFSFAVNNIPSGATASYSNMPITAAFDYYFMDEGIKPYAGLEAGFIYSSIKTSQTVSGINVEVTGSKSGLLIAPVVGVAYGVNDALDIMLNAKYMYGMTSGKMDVTATAGGQSQTTSIDWYDATFVNINLGVSYKFGN
ncbi:MAG: OmpW family outer membrane protein [Bacteroidia bacterium]